MSKSRWPADRQFEAPIEPMNMKTCTTQPHSDDRTPTCLSCSIQVSSFHDVLSPPLSALSLSVSFKAKSAALSLCSFLACLFSISALYYRSFRLGLAVSHFRLFPSRFAWLCGCVGFFPSLSHVYEAHGWLTSADAVKGRCFTK